MKSQSLYTITNKYEQAFQEFDESLEEGELSSDIVFNTLEAIEGEFKDKIENVASYIKHIDAMVKANKEAEKQIKERRQRLERQQASLKNYVISSMNSAGYKKLPYSRFNVSIRKCPPSLKIDDERLLSKYMTERVIRDLNKAQVKEDLKLGCTMQGAHLEYGDSLTIK